MTRALALALVLAACTTMADDEPSNGHAAAPPTVAASDRGGNRLEVLEHRNGRSCTPDNAWCVAPSGEFFNMRNGGSTVVTGATREEETQSTWPFAIRRANGHVIMGIVFTTSEMYSGGGATASVITLYDIASGQDAATPVVSLPYGGSASIRACFDEEDRRARREACSDEYEMSGSINLDATSTGAWPRLIFTTDAWTYPGRVSRSEDSTQAPPLTRADLVWAHDEACTYRRVLTYAPGAEGYAPDAPLPECSDYLTQ
ncbi:hypothetical protein [Terricaulis sp.]|uniref:hypothetical protein n=1 Tax=Terricaulis sp. TaxID=2768686 RepID=UPI003783D09F